MAIGSHEHALSMSHGHPSSAQGHHSLRFKRIHGIRWHEYDPLKRAANSKSDPFVQWQPPQRPQQRKDAEDCKGLLTEKDAAKSPSSAIAASNKAKLSPLQPLPKNGIRTDPFTIYPIKATDTVRHTMDYFTTICNDIAVEGSVLPHVENPHLTLLLPFALKHVLLFESIVALCRASVLISLGKPAFEDMAFVYHRGNVLTGLNSKLASKKCTDDDALLTVTMLMTLEYLIGNFNAVKMHYKGLERMLELRGGCSDASSHSNPDWTQFMRSGITAYKALGSFVTGQAPTIPADSPGFVDETFEELVLNKPLSYAENPFSPDLCIILSRLPRGFAELVLRTRISLQTINILASTHLIATQHDGLDLEGPFVAGSRLSGSSNPSPAHHDRKSMIIQNLLSSLQRLSLMSPSALELCLSYGLVAFLFQLRRLAPLNLFYDPLLQQFLKVVPCHPKPTTAQEQSCLLWASVAVAGALALRPIPIPNAHLVFDHILELYPDARKWSWLERVLRNFFWTDSIGLHWKTVWQAGMKRRALLLRQQGGFDEEEGLPVLKPASPLPEVIAQHIRGAPKAMGEMSWAMGVCPFRPRSSTSVASSTA